MARIEIYSNDSNVTLDDKVIGTDALDNSTKNFTVGDMLALGGGSGTTYTAGAGIDITNNVISSTVVDTDTNKYVSAVNLVGTDLDFDFNDNSLLSVSLSSIADKTVSLTGTGGIAITGTYPSFTIDGSAISGGGGGTTYTAGAGIDITNNVISSTVVDTDTNNFVSNVVLNGTDLDFTGTGGAFQSSVSLSTIADQTVTLTGASGITIAGTYPNFTISSATVDTNTTYDYGAVGALGNIILALGGSDGTNDVVTMQAGSKITLTDNGSNTFTVDHSIIGTAKTTNTTTLAPGDTFKAIDAVTYSDGHLTQYREQTYTLPAAASPETLILRFIGGNVPLQGQDLLFESTGTSTGTSTTTDSLHINPVELVPGSSGFEVVNACIAKVSLGAYIDNGPQNQAGQITFEIEENLSGVATQLGNATFDIQNQVGIIPITFLSFFDFQAGGIYIFRAYSAQHEMDIVPGSFIQIEILK